MIGSRLYGGHLGSIECIYPVHGHNIHSLGTVNYQLPRGETLFHLPLTNILENIQRLFRLQICLSRKSSTIFRKYSKTFWATNSSNQQQQSTAAINSSHQQQQSTAATSSSNQQQPPAAAISSSHQQQQSTAATSSSNQQQPPAAAINSSNQQQQSTAATKTSIRQQQSTAATTSFRPTSITSTIHDDLRYIQLRFLALATSC